jgi:hypothetical protein
MFESTRRPIPEHVEPQAGRAGLELPTFGIALALYGGFLLLTWYFQDLPVWVAAPLGSLLLAANCTLMGRLVLGPAMPTTTVGPRASEGVLW